MHAKFAGILSFFRTVSTFASCSLQGSGRGLWPVKMLEVGFLVILAAVTPIFYLNATPETVARRLKAGKVVVVTPAVTFYSHS